MATPSARLITKPHGFLLLRVIADEAEILALATDPTQQRRGHASALMAAALERLARDGVVNLHLEVAARNAPARQFYRQHGFAETGLRRGYYRLADGEDDDAVLMARAPG